MTDSGSTTEESSLDREWPRDTWAALCLRCRSMRLEDLLGTERPFSRIFKDAYRKSINVEWNCKLCAVLDGLVARAFKPDSECCENINTRVLPENIQGTDLDTFKKDVEGTVGPERHFTLSPLKDRVRGALHPEGFAFLECKNIAHPGGKKEHSLYVINGRGAWGLKSGIHGIIGLAAKEGSPAATHVPRRLVNSDRVGPDSVKMLHDWLQTCNEHHSTCRRSICGKHIDPEPPLPTRLLDRYREDGFALEDLPRTLRDAARVTRRLGFRYIWIDSLCIVQDSVEDWERESKRMGAVYENAYCTIAATQAPNDDTEFLQGPMVKTVAVPCDLDDATKGMYFVTEPYQSEFKQVEQARLNHRGWVVQERLLSRRTIHFAKEQVFWECRQEILGEDGSRHRAGGAEGLAGLARSISDLEAGRGRFRESSSLWEADEFEQTFIRRWQGIIATYSACDFTKSSDRLPALLGLADRLGSINNMEYHHGNWINTQSRHPPRSLAWWACAPGKNSSNHGQVRAPSWSWSALEGEVCFEQQDRQPLAELLSVEVSERMGLPNYVALKMRGRFCTVSTRWPPPRVAEIYTTDSESGAEGESVAVGHITFDSVGDMHAKLDCLFLYVDSAGSPTVLALKSEETGGGGLPEYRRLGIGSLTRQTGETVFGEEVEFVLI
ncbi:hypothetical protein DBV05_g9777 [Lasiodiplodia theobromae]|uniref:Heterokaryon incompatibility domain-containing protein n=1 Tax=Lasiodiplodia theobromae TaxID=45133 RepID=A0A5N5D1Z4_9PEZI|nr:hypothetical protein DBV05_g9777 [Lasiodiplodia theobromae]